MESVVRNLCLAIMLSVLCSISSFADDGAFHFKEQTIDANLDKVCYAVTVADVNGDDQPDVVAVSNRRVLWFENPTWKPHVIIEDQVPLDHVCIAANDIDGDGQIDFALGAGWTKKGTLHWLRRGESLDEPWHVHSVSEELWLHRMRWADVLGTGKKQLVISPLNPSKAKGVRLMAFEIPENPKRDRWRSTVLNDELSRMHNHWHVDFDGDKQVDTLTASLEGIHLIQKNGDDWKKTKLGPGIEADDPKKTGAGEIKLGQLANGKRFIVTVEPMHGHQVAVLIPNEDESKWTSHVIDGNFSRGHALWTGDLDGDGADEIAFGHSDTKDTFGVIVYKCLSADGRTWAKHVVDAGRMATEDLTLADLDGDGRLDIIAGGRATHNVKIYWNRTSKPKDE